MPMFFYLPSNFHLTGAWPTFRNKNFAHSDRPENVVPVTHRLACIKFVVMHFFEHLLKTGSISVLIFIYRIT